MFILSFLPSEKLYIYISYDISQSKLRSYSISYENQKIVKHF